VTQHARTQSDSKPYRGPVTTVNMTMNGNKNYGMCIDTKIKQEVKLGLSGKAIVI
jgi:hypothetical protein